jgi:hypothetical protein
MLRSYLSITGEVIVSKIHENEFDIDESLVHSLLQSQCSMM